MISSGSRAYDGFERFGPSYTSSAVRAELQATQVDQVGYNWSERGVIDSFLGAA